jgi:hypothetical protein
MPRVGVEETPMDGKEEWMGVDRMNIRRLDNGMMKNIDFILVPPLKCK